MKTAKELIIEALDEFDVEGFVDPSFNEAAAHKIIGKLEWDNYKIVKMVRKKREPFVFSDD